MEDHLDLSSCTMDSLFRGLADRLGTKWQPLATYLDVSTEKIDCIKIQYPLDPSEQAFRMFQTWLKIQYKSKDEPASRLPEDLKWLLVSSLKQCHRNDLAAEISKGKLKTTRLSSASNTNVTSSGNPLTTPDIPNEKLLRGLVEMIPAHWQKLATQLNVSSEQIDVITEKHRDVDEQAFQMLRMWKQANPHLDHQNHLRIALQNVGRNDVAVKFFPQIKKEQE